MHCDIARCGAGQKRAAECFEEAISDQLLVTILENVRREDLLTTGAVVNRRWLRVSTSKVLAQAILLALDALFLICAFRPSKLLVLNKEVQISCK